MLFLYFLKHGLFERKQSGTVASHLWDSTNGKLVSDFESKVLKPPWMRDDVVGAIKLNDAPETMQLSDEEHAKVKLEAEEIYKKYFVEEWGEKRSRWCLECFNLKSFYSDDLDTIATRLTAQAAEQEKEAEAEDESELAEEEEAEAEPEPEPAPEAEPVPGAELEPESVEFAEIVKASKTSVALMDQVPHIELQKILIATLQKQLGRPKAAASASPNSPPPQFS